METNAIEVITKSLDKRDQAHEARAAAIDEKLDGIAQSTKKLDDRLFAIEQARASWADADGPAVHTKAHAYKPGRVLAALADPKGRLDGLEAEWSQELKAKLPADAPGQYAVPIRTKALDAGSESPTSGGAGFIQTTVLPDVIPPLAQASLYQRLNPRAIRGGPGPIHLPRVAGGATGYIVTGDGQDVTESEHSVDTVSLDPLYYGALAKANMKVIRQSNPDVERMVFDDLVRQIGVLVDSKAFAGSGSGEARGLYTAAANTASANSPEDVTYAQLIEMQKLLIDDKVPMDGWVYVASPAAWQTMATTTKTSGDTSSNFIAQEGRNGGWTAAGLPLYTTTHLSGNRVILYRPASAVFGDWGALLLDADPYGSNFASGTVSFRGFLPFDSDVTHDEAVAKLN